ncbi:hypothetical protein KEM56_005380 [Ascosphaera pollenicola]|nr:hypothetical protein KEM56_005380 [Ascosphaera pollenicola]
MESPSSPKKSSSKRKPKQRQGRAPRRTQVVDADGWTHVVTANKRSGHRKGNSTRAMKGPSLAAQEDVLVPAEAPDGLTFEQLKKKFQRHLEQWESSRTWQRLKGALETDQLRTVSQKLEQCVCIGLGSPSDCGSPDAYTVINESESEVPPAANPLKCYAQDPVFNELDIKLLDYLDITVVTDTAFSMVDSSTFLYAPGAERAQLALLLDKRPPLFFGGPLSDLSSVTVSEERAAEAKAIDAYAADSAAAELPIFEPSENAFWKMSLFWQSQNQVEEGTT